MNITIDVEKLKAIIVQDLRELEGGSFMVDSTALIGEINGCQIQITVTRDEFDFMDDGVICVTEELTKCKDT